GYASRGVGAGGVHGVDREYHRARRFLRGARAGADLPGQAHPHPGALCARRHHRHCRGAKLTEAWGQQVLVENRPGGNGFIAMTAGAKAAPDGYTLTMVTVGDVAINPALFKEMPYDVERDLAPIAMVSDAPMVLAANADGPLKSVADAIA